MNNGNRVGSGNGGFHSYCRFPQPTPARSVSPATEMSQAIGANADGSECTIWEQDQFMPIANVVRIMRRILPPHTKISDDSKVTIQECITAFISFVTSEASDRCQREQRKTITAEDLLWAMNTLGLYDYIELLTLYLHRYREFDGGERGSLRGEPLVLKRPTVDPPSGCNIMPYHQPPNFPMVDPPSSCNIMPYHLPPNFPMVDPPSSCNIMPYHLPPNFPMAPHHGYFVYPPPMGNGYMQGDASSVITSHCAVAAVDSDVESPAEKIRSDQFLIC